MYAHGDIWNDHKVEQNLETKPSNSPKSKKNGFQRIFANMKRAKSKNFFTVIFGNLIKNGLVLMEIL